MKTYRNCLMVACVAGLLGWAAMPARAEAPKVGEKAEFKYTTTEGKEVTPESVKGQVVVFDFWATWCGPCMRMGPHMVELNKQYEGKGVMIIGVSLDKDVKKMAEGAKAKGFTWPEICDGKGWQNDFAVKWGVKSIPHCVLLGPDGTVLWAGYPQAIDEPLKAAVEKYSPKGGELPAAKGAEGAPITVAKPAGAAGSMTLADLKLLQAESDRKAGRRVEAYDGYKWVVSQGAASRAGKAAAEQVAALEGDEAFMTGYKKVVREREAAGTLRTAQNLEKAGKGEQAREVYQKIVTEFADTPSGAAAKEALER